MAVFSIKNTVKNTTFRGINDSHAYIFAVHDEKIFSLTSSRKKVATQFYFLPFSEDGFAAKNFWKLAHIYLMKRKSFLIGDGGK